MKTLTEHAEDLKIKPESLQRKIRRMDLGSFKLDEIIPETVLKELNTPSFKRLKRQIEINGKEFNSLKQKVVPKPTPITKRKPLDIRKILIILPLPMLGLAASYGVFYFASHFAPTVVAIFEAMAFELTYIGLAMMEGLPESRRIYAKRVSIFAVAVSVIYNTIAGAIHTDPNLLTNLSPVWFWILAVIHGGPLAILAYFVADLIFHQKKKS